MRGRIRAIFVIQTTACSRIRSQKGGCITKKRMGVSPMLSFIPLILSGLSPLFVAPLCRTGKFRGDDSDPPRNGGGMRLRVAGMRIMPSPPPRNGSLSSSFIPAGRLNAPRSGR